jgi:flagellin-like protein
MGPRATAPGPEGDGPTGRTGGERAVSPVVAVVLLLGVTVLLAAVAGPLVFGVVGEFGSDTPDAEFAFLYEQGEPLDTGTTTDDFGTPVTDGNGLVTVQLQEGDTLDPANVEIRTNVSGGNLLEDTPDDVFASGEMVRDGTELTVAAERNETVSVIWRGDNGEESAILGDFSVVAPARPTALEVPGADGDCEYIESQLEDGESDNDVTVSGVVIECDLDQYYPRITDITIQSENGDFGAIIGEVNGTGDININRGGVFQGNIESGTDGDDGDVDLTRGSTVYGNIIGKGDSDITAVNGSKIEGRVETTGAVNVKTGSSVGDEIVSGTDGSGGDVDVIDGRVEGSIETVGDGDATIDGASTVLGGVDATGAVNVKTNSSVGGDIASGTDGSDGDVQVSSSDVDGDITANGDGTVDIDEVSTVSGDVTSTAGVDVQTNSEVGGGLLSGTAGSGGDIQVSSSDVGGPIVAQSGGKIDIYGDSTVEGPINNSNGAIQITQSTVEGALTTASEQNIKIESSSTVEGSLTAVGNGTLKILSGSTVGGPIDAERCVKVQGGSSVAGGITMGTYASNGNDCTKVDSSTVGGPITADGPAKLSVYSSTIGGLFNPHPQSLFECSSSTLGGKDCSEVKVPEYEFNITSMDTAVSKGSTLAVDLTVWNVGFGGTKELPLYLNGSEELTKSISLSRNKKNNDVQFQWDTDGTDKGAYNLTVASNLESASHTVYIAGPSSPAWEVESVDSAEDVLAGKNLSVTTEIRNNGGSTGTTTVELLDSDGQTVDTNNVKVQDDASKEVTLEWNTSSDDVGAGGYTVNTVNESASGSTEVLKNVYELQDVALYESGDDIEVELFLKLSNDATADIEVFKKNGNRVGDKTVDAASEVYTVPLTANPNSIKNGEVVVTLYDRDGDQRGTKTRDWDGGS